jgi:hypothetical protein
MIFCGSKCLPVGDTGHILHKHCMHMMGPVHIHRDHTHSRNKCLPTDLDLLADSRQLRDPACGCIKVIR